MASRTTTDPIEILLEMGVDLDNLSSEEDYLSALMEAVNTLTIKDPTDPRIAPLQLEVRNVRKQRKAADPKFKERKAKIDPSKIRFTSVSIAPKQKALPTSALVPNRFDKDKDKDKEKEGKKKRTKSEKDTNIIAKIAKNVTDIAGILRKQSNQKKKASRSERIRAEKAKRKLQESNLEKSFNVLGKVAERIIAPVKSLLERIFDFFLKLFIGRFLVKLIGWIGDPKNQEKVTSLVRFFSDHGPKLLGLYLLFGTRIGRFLVRLGARLVAGTASLLLGVGRAAVSLAARYPFLVPLLAGAGLFAAGKVVPDLLPDTVDAEEKKTEAAPGTKEEKLEKLREQKENLSFIDKLFGVDREIDEQIEFLETGRTAKYGAAPGQGFSGGGQVSGPSGIDKVPAMLTDGEFVMSAGAVQKYGIQQLESMNAAGGGTNRPKVVDNTLYASVGGYVGDKNKLGKRGTPEAEKEKSSGSVNLMPSMGYRLGQVNPETFVSASTEVSDKISMVEGKRQPRGQGGRVLGSTTARGNLGTRVYEDGHLVESFDRFGRKKEYGAPKGIMRALAGLGDLLTGDLFDFDRRTDRGNVFESRMVTEEMGDGYRVKDDVTIKETIAAIGKPDLIENQQQILKQLPKGTTIQDVMKGASAIPGVTPDQLRNILATSDAQKATNLKQKRARRLDEAIRGIDPNDPTAGYSMSASDMTPALQQAEATANKRHAELMKSTNPEKITAYDKKHGEGAYSQKLKEKLYRTYGAGARQTQPAASKPTGQVVGRENLSPQAQAAIARLEAKKGLPPDMQYTRNGKKISAEEFNRVKRIPGGGKPGGFLGGIMEGAKNMLGGMFKPSETETIVRDGNVGIPTAEEQRYIDEDKAGRAKIDAKYKARDEERSKAASKQAEHDRLFGEYRYIVMNEDHPLHRKVAGDLFTDDEGMKFEDFKKFKSQQAQVKPPAKLSLATTPPKVTPPPPPSMEPKVTVIPGPAAQGGDSGRPVNGSGSEVDARPTGNGNENKFKIFGISMPF